MLASSLSGGFVLASSLVTGPSLHPQRSFSHICNDSFNLPSRIAFLLADSIFLLMLCLTVHPHLDRLQKNLGKLRPFHPLASLELGLLFCLCLNECAYPHIVCVHTLITYHSAWLLLSVLPRFALSVFKPISVDCVSLI